MNTKLATALLLAKPLTHRLGLTLHPLVLLLLTLGELTQLLQGFIDGLLRALLRLRLLQLKLQLLLPLLLLLLLLW